MTPLVELVSDWGGFEELVKKLHETGTVKVDRDVKLIGKAGVPRQIDVLVTHTEGLYTHRILVECKYWREAVKRTQIDAMVTAIDDLNASKGVVFTTKGYQSGAEGMAKASGIEIFVVREMSDEEWGLPGRVIDFYVQTIHRAIGNIAFPGARSETRGAEPPGNQLSLHSEVGPDGFMTMTPLLLNGHQSATLEAILDELMWHAVQRVLATTGIVRSGADCTVHQRMHVEYAFELPALYQLSQHTTVMLPRIECDVGVRIHQFRFQFDRGSKYLFSLALENCVTGAVFAATREKNAEVSSLAKLGTGSPDIDKSLLLQNGSLMRVTMKPMFNFAELPPKSDVLT